jgi:hypothetical protein
MKNHISKKTSSFLTALVMTLSCASGALAESTVTDVSIENGTLTSATVSGDGIESGRLYAAVYEDDILKGGAVSAIDENGKAVFENGLSFDSSLQKLRFFVWDDNMRPLSESYEYEEVEEVGDGIIHLLGDEIKAIGVENVTVDGSTVTITEAGEYTIEGTLTEGQIVVNSSSKDDKITINLNGVNVTSSVGNAFDGQKGKITLVPTKKESTFTSLSSGDDSTAIYSKHDLTIKGDGVLRAVSSFGNGIRCKKDLEIGVCDLYVNSANNGIKGDSSVKITKKNNSVTVVSGGDAIKSDTLPSLESGVYVSGGTVTINGGKISINSDSDGIQADTLLSLTGGELNITSAGEALKANASSETDSTPEEGDGVIEISGGSVVAVTGEDGIKAVKNLKISGGDINVTSKTDALQSDGTINITGGTFTITANGGAPTNISTNNASSDSCKGIKAASLIDISGGTFEINTYDDAIHSNNTIRISGGTINAATGDDGIHADSYLLIEDGADINITKCYEGIEAAKIYVNGGKTRISAYDDGVNGAGEEPKEEAVSLLAFNGGWNGPNWGGEDNTNYGYIEINGGYLYVTTTNGDGLDANGNIVLNGGVTVVDGATAGSEDGLDFDKGVEFNGGYILTMTSGGMDSISGSYNQKYLLYGFGSSMGNSWGRPGGTTSNQTLSAGNYCIVDSSNNVLCAFSRTKGSVKRIVFSSPSVVSGTYYIKKLDATGEAEDSLYGSVDSDYNFTLNDGCSVNTSGTSYQMSTY